MTHMRRQKSETGFYHVVAKGDGGQILFESDTNRLRFIAEMKRAVDDFKVKIHAYCLMSNHVHLLVQDLEDELSAFMKQLCESYAMYFGRITGRVGRVFHSRFWSEPVDTDEHFLAAVRYIHANPEPQGMCRAKDYPWSSYRAFAKHATGQSPGPAGNPTFIHTDLALGLFGSYDSFESFHANGGCHVKPYSKSALSNHLSYDELLAVAIHLLGRETLNSLKGMKPNERLPHFQLLAKSGFTDTQIARITGIGQSSIHRALKAYNA